MSNKLFFRFQGTRKIEHNSIYTDLVCLYEDYCEGYTKDYLLDKYKYSLKLRKGISPSALVDKVLKCRDANEVDEFVDKYKVDGVFAEEYRDELLPELLHRDIQNTIAARDFTYLIIFEGSEIARFGDDGIVTKMDKIIKIYKTNIK